MTYFLFKQMKLLINTVWEILGKKLLEELQVTNETIQIKVNHKSST